MSTTVMLLEASKQDNYSDDYLFGPRKDAIERIEFAKANNNPDCIIRVSNGAVVDKQQWNIKKLIENDYRLNTMVNTIKATHAWSIQRYCWPQIHHSLFPIICVAPKMSGKTFTHIFYIVSRCVFDVPEAKTKSIICDAVNEHKWTPEHPKPKLEATEDGDEDLDFDAIHEANENLRAQTTSADQQEDTQATQGVGWPSEDIDPNDFINHPKYIVVCSSQKHVETIAREVDRMKLAAFGEKIFGEKQNRLPPRVAIIHVHQTDDKLAIKFNGCDLLITTPGSLYKCINLKLVDFTRCRRVFFDDIDLSLQLHNASIREIFKLFVVQMHDIDQEAAENGYNPAKASSTCKMHMFSRKWTDLMKQSINTVFKQHVLMFGSIAEASIYANLRYELEFIKSDSEAFSKLLAHVERYECNAKCGDIMAITCSTNAEAKFILSKLDNTSLNKTIVRETESFTRLKMAGRNQKGPIYIISDSALEFIIEDLNNVTHLIHFTLSEDLIKYDQRFRLMYHHLVSSNSVDMTSTVFVRPKTSNEFLKELYDVLSRSSTTLRGTKLELRDFISDKSNKICWRWASTGICRLEKLSKDDKFGSFCPDRHSFLPTDVYNNDNRWPKSGQIKLTVTHLVSPNEFYFWFEAYRDKNSPMKKWRKFERAGTEFMQSVQKDLNELKDVPKNNVPLTEFNQGQVYGIYFNGVNRVDRVILLHKLNFNHLTGGNLKVPREQFIRRYNHEYKNQAKAFRIDHGTRVNVTLENLFILPEHLASIEPQCYRAFHLGVKPTDNEPDWLYKANKNFYELVCVQNLKEVTAWIRMQSGRTFWLDNMLVSRELPEVGRKGCYKTSPHEELINRNLALKCTTEPSCLPVSDRLETLCKWDTDQATRLAQWAFLRKDLDHIDIYVNHVYGVTQLQPRVRLASYNKQLIALESRIRQAYENHQLQSLNYFAEGIICVARLHIYTDPDTNVPFYEFNRCRINKIITRQRNEDPDSVDEGASLNLSEYFVECLDHGDYHTVTKGQLYLAKLDYISALPFQSIRCSLADQNESILSDPKIMHKSKELLYDLTRDESDQLKVVTCTLKNQQNELYIYLPTGKKGWHVPLIALFEEQGISICSNDDPDLRTYKEFLKPAMGSDDEIEEGSVQVGSEEVMVFLIASILDDIIMKELGIEQAKMDMGTIEEEEEEDDECSDESLVNGISEMSMS